MSDQEKIKELLNTFEQDDNCIIHPPINKSLDVKIPKELETFFSLCNGVSLFIEESFGIEIVGINEFITTNEFLYPKGDVIWEELEGDVTNHWYLIAKSEELSQFISIDLTSEKFGECYDSYYDVHGEKGLSQIVAKSFYELLNSFYNSKGESWFWLAPNFQQLGDAFDE